MTENTLIIESTDKKKPLLSDYSDTSIVHCRNSLILQKALGADLIEGQYKLPEILKKKYDVIICCYASPYAPNIPYREILHKNPDARLIWLVNDHDLEDNQLLRYAIMDLGRTYDMICNNPRKGYRHWILGKKIKDGEGNVVGKLNQYIINWLTTNLNSLIMDRSSINDYDGEKDGIIYYGTFRKWRADHFAHHLQEGVTCSSSKKHWKKFDAIDCKCSMINKLSWAKGEEDLRKYKYSLYIEDIHTHENFAFLANRYYEALMCGVVVLFDHHCKNTIEKSKYIIPDEFVIPEDSNIAEYSSTLDYKKMLEIQNQNINTTFKDKENCIQSIKDFTYFALH
jgi:sporulation protein YlmC with PRC-barrel domain